MTTITIGAELLSKATRLLDKLDPDMVFTASFAGEVSGIVLLLKDALSAPATAPDASQMIKLRAKGVVDADNNLDCWDTPPYDLCYAHVAAIHERESPTFMGEPVLLDIAVPTPAWRDAPEVAALKAERDELLAALKAMYSEAIRIRCSIHQKWLQIMNTASAAIAKAEGEST